jgi:AcrR family transcriptional regulator
LQLTREDWLQAGLRLLAASDIENVKVETLTKELHISKGSFYHYWSNRSLYLQDLLATWEQQRTHTIIQELEQLATPQQRFQYLFEKSFSGNKTLEAAIHQWAGKDTTVARRVAAIEEVRLAYLTKILCDLGKPFLLASSLARVCYLTYLGWIDWNQRNNTDTKQLASLMETLWQLIQDSHISSLDC